MNEELKYLIDEFERYHNNELTTVNVFKNKYLTQSDNKENSVYILIEGGDNNQFEWSGKYL